MMPTFMPVKGGMEGSRDVLIRLMSGCVLAEARYGQSVERPRRPMAQLLCPRYHYDQVGYSPACFEVLPQQLSCQFLPSKAWIADNVLRD